MLIIRFCQFLSSDNCDVMLLRIHHGDPFPAVSVLSLRFVVGVSRFWIAGLLSTEPSALSYDVPIYSSGFHGTCVCVVHLMTWCCGGSWNVDPKNCYDNWLLRIRRSPWLCALRFSSKHQISLQNPNTHTMMITKHSGVSAYQVACE